MHYNFLPFKRYVKQTLFTRLDNIFYGKTAENRTFVITLCFIFCRAFCLKREENINEEILILFVAVINLKINFHSLEVWL